LVKKFGELVEFRGRYEGLKVFGYGGVERSLDEERCLCGRMREEE